MVKKKSDKQNVHDQNVKAIADELKQDKWDVRANLEGYEKPAQMKDFLPDIEAKKGGLKRICEVVTEEMFKGDKQKYLELKNYCDEYDFHFYIIGKDGKRNQIDPETFGKK